MPLVDLEARRAYMREYNARPHARAARKRYEATPEARAIRRAYDAKTAAVVRRQAHNKTPAYRRTAAKYAASARGKARQREGRYRRRYGLTPEAVEAMIASQNGRCAICDGPPGNRPFSVDHCHRTGRVRGMLCVNCNMGIGNLGDDPVLLRKATAYLEKFSCA